MEWMQPSSRKKPEGLTVDLVPEVGGDLTSSYTHRPYFGTKIVCNSSGGHFFLKKCP